MSKGSATTRAIVIVGSILGTASTIIGLWFTFPDKGHWVLIGIVGLWIIIWLYLARNIICSKLGIELIPPKNINKLVTTDLNYADVAKAITVLVNKMRGQKPPFIPHVIIGIDRGGSIVGGMLGKAMNIPVAYIASRKEWTISSIEGSLDDGLKDTDKRTEARRSITKILLVDDVSRSGNTLARAFEHLQQYPALKEVEIKRAVILYEEPIAKDAREPEFFVYRTKTTDLQLPWVYIKEK